MQFWATGHQPLWKSILCFCIVRLIGMMCQFLYKFKTRRRYPGSWQTQGGLDSQHKTWWYSSFNHETWLPSKYFKFVLKQVTIMILPGSHAVKTRLNTQPFHCPVKHTLLYMRRFTRDAIVFSAFTHWFSIAKFSWNFLINQWVWHHASVINEIVPNVFNCRHFTVCSFCLGYNSCFTNTQKLLSPKLKLRLRIIAIGLWITPIVIWNVHRQFLLTLISDLTSKQTKP